MKKNFVLSEQAINVLKQDEVKFKIMAFFGIKDPRTLESYLRQNLPQSDLMNFNVKGLILEYAPFMTDAEIYRKLSSQESDAINKTKQKIKKEYMKKKVNNEKDGENNQSIE